MEKISTFNKFLAAGTVLAFILIGIAGIYAVHVAELALSPKQENTHTQNPLLSSRSEQPPIDNGIPTIPGVKIYSAEKDADIIIRETEKNELQFAENHHKGTVDNSNSDLMRKKEQFAAERLLFLQKVESAPTREERIKLIKEFRQHCKN